MPNLIPILIVFVLFFLGVPVAFAMLIASFIYFTFMCEGVTMFTMVSSLLTQSESFTMLAVPFFITAGTIMGYGGVSEKLMDFCEILTGRFTGGLGAANCLLSTFMGGISGSSCADAAFEAKMLVPEMRKRGYSNGYASAITAASSCITPIIPPGIALIIYATAANCSIGDMFMAGYIPGLLICIVLMLTNYFVSKKRGWTRTREEKVTAREILYQLGQSIWALFMPLGIIMGMRLGWFTPTECAAVTVVYTTFVGAVIYRKLKWKHTMRIIVESVNSTASVVLILSAASLFSRYMVWENIPQKAATALAAVSTNRFIFIIIVLLFMMVLGMFLDTAAALVILPPLLLPVATSLGIDVVHFGIILCLMDTIGGITPPFGVMMFAVMGVTKVSVKDYLKEGWPLILAVFAVILLTSFVPQICMTLVNL
ncbi:MAG: TRAP transporter large permease [Clostridiales bacterium]|nr:TRAP transporter large permease [Clostridiales bacterium]